MIKKFDKPIFSMRSVEETSIYPNASNMLMEGNWYYNEINTTGPLFDSIETQTLIDTDKIMFTQDAPFPSSMFNKLGMPIKKVIKNPTKIIIPNNLDKLWNDNNYGYILFVNGIYIFISKWQIKRNQTINDIARKFHSNTIIKVYNVGSKKNAKILETINQYSDKLVKHHDFVKYIWEHSPKLDNDTWESIKALLESGDFNNIKIAADLLFQFNFSKYLMHIRYALQIGANNMPRSYYKSVAGYIESIKNYTTFKYLNYVCQDVTTYGYPYIYSSVNSHFNEAHQFYNKLLNINYSITINKLPEKYKIEV